EPASGSSFAKRSRIAASTGMLRSAHSIRRIPSSASVRSFTSCLRVVAIRRSLLWVESSGGEEPLVLALLPVERIDAAAVEPRVERGAEIWLPSQARSEDDVSDLERKPSPQLPQRPELVQLAQVVRAVAGPRPGGDDEPGRLQIAEHPRRPARAFCCLAHAHRKTLTHVCQGSMRP